MVNREILENGAVRLSCERCAFDFHRLRPGVLLVKVSGYDKGEFGLAPLNEIQSEISNYGPISLHIDAEDAVGAVAKVSDEWTAWFRANRESLKHVSVLVGSELFFTVVAISKVLSHTGDMIQIHSDRAPFARELEALSATPSQTGQKPPHRSKQSMRPKP